MLQTVEGIYKNGIIQLKEIPENITESQVLITFIENPLKVTPSQMIKFGMFSGVNQSTEADFQEAEFKDNFNQSWD
jgi:hypothetical protein